MAAGRFVYAVAAVAYSGFSPTGVETGAHVRDGLNGHDNHAPPSVRSDRQTHLRPRRKCRIDPERVHVGHVSETTGASFAAGRVA